MSKLRILATAFVTAVAMSMCAMPALAYPGDDNGLQDQNADAADQSISYAAARQLAVDYGLTGYSALPLDVAQNLAQGAPLPANIVKQRVPAVMLTQLPYTPGQEWQIVGDNLVLIAVGSDRVTSMLAGVFS